MFFLHRFGSIFRRELKVKEGFLEDRMAHRESVPVKTNREQLGGTEDGSERRAASEAKAPLPNQMLNTEEQSTNRRWRSGCLRQGRKFVRSLF